MQPQIFISAVTSELGSARQLAANVLIRLGYQPVWQDSFGTEAGDLRQVLREKINACDGVICLVGFAYGAEPSVPDPEFGRVSYTQYELLHARAAGKRVWIFFIEEGYCPDRPLAELDTPPSISEQLDREAYQAERRQLQAVWRDRLRSESNLWHAATTSTEFKLLLIQLKDELRELRRNFRWTQRFIVTTLVAIFLLGGATWWHLSSAQHRTAERVEQTAETVIQTDAKMAKVLSAAEELKKFEADFRPENLKIALNKAIETMYQTDVSAADKLTDWKERDNAKTTAISVRDKRLLTVDELLTSIARTIASGDASPEFIELTRIIQQQGIEEALAYIATQKPRLLQQAERIVADRRREIRQTLAPLLEAVRIRQSMYEYHGAIADLEEILRLEPDWTEALERHCDVISDFMNKIVWGLTVGGNLDGSTAAELDAFTERIRLGEVSARKLNLLFPQDEARQKQLELAQLCVRVWYRFRITHAFFVNDIGIAHRDLMKLRELSPRTADQLLLAAIIYSQGADMLEQSQSMTAEEIASERRRCLEESLACLKEAKALGFVELGQLEDSNELSAVRDTPAFQKWLKADRRAKWPRYDGRCYPVVTPVAGNGIAHGVGVKPGDLYISYNGCSLANAASVDVLLDFVEAAKNNTTDTVEVQFVRDGQLLQFDVTGGTKLGIGADYPEEE